MKPTYGRCSRWGIVAFASSLDQAGPFTRTVRDAAILLRSMASHDPKDTTSVDRPVPDYEAVGGSVKGLKIGIPKEYRLDGMPDEIDRMWRTGRGVAQERGRRDCRRVAAAHPIRAAGLLHPGAGGGLVQSRAL
jgi:aspartyl-tRNA(Asn)/glutamyl-tRNA(Gln) amidotransferase subunit A